jgi:hypothetical protein
MTAITRPDGGIELTITVWPPTLSGMSILATAASARQSLVMCMCMCPRVRVEGYGG